jgi:hypothetical protein
MTGADLKIVQNTLITKYYIEGIGDNVELILTSQSGEVLYNGPVKNKEIMSIRLPFRGMYTVHIITSTGVVEKKFEK